MATYQTLLTQIDAAIEALLTGGVESYSIGARTVTKLDLDDLFKWREQVNMAANRQSRGTVRVARIQKISK